MTASAMADLLHARRVGPGRWMARCRSHQDRSPSLSICAGKDGRVLVHCHAGCPTEAVVEAAGLRMADLFAGSAPSPQVARRAAQERDGREEQARQRRIAHGRACDHIHKLERMAEALATKLARLPDDDADAEALARLFHSTMDKVHAAEIRELDLRP